MTYSPPFLSIKSWAEEDRPREKLLHKGKAALSDAELLAILLGSGSKEESAVVLAQKILHSVGQNLNELGRCSIAELQTFKGVGPAKAIVIAAATELGRRRQMSRLADKPQISSSRSAFEAIAPVLVDLQYEEFWMLNLNRANRVMSRTKISSGGVAGTVVDAKIVFRRALHAEASSIILCHNHPSGSLRPSEADLELTKKLVAAGKAVDITVLDHLIVSDQGYYSFADEGKL